MVSVKIQHSTIKKAQAKEYFTLSLSGLFSYPKDNPSQKRDARCTNILHTGATLSGVGEGQRLRRGFQNGVAARMYSKCTSGELQSDSITLVYGRDYEPLLRVMPLATLQEPTAFESLPSAAANKAPSAEYDVMIDKPLR